MKRKNEVVCTGVPPFSLGEKEYSDFVLNIENAVLASLKARGLLTEKQRRLCTEEVKKRRLLNTQTA